MLTRAKGARISRRSRPLLSSKLRIKLCIARVSINLGKLDGRRFAAACPATVVKLCGYRRPLRFETRLRKLGESQRLIWGLEFRRESDLGVGADSGTK